MNRRTPERGTPSQTDIAARAYQIWEREGRPQGRSQQHWEQAARELMGELEPSSAPKPARRGGKRKPAVVAEQATLEPGPELLRALRRSYAVQGMLR